MKTIIIEDELLAQKEIERLLSLHFPTVEVLDRLTSVVKATHFLIERGEEIDFIISDVELSDGTCFDIFSRVSPPCPIIFTTAYNEYAIKAFKVDGIDYLLKPVDEQEFVQAVAKCIKRLKRIATPDKQEALNDYRLRLTIRIGEKIVVVQTDEMAYCFSEEKQTYIVTREGKRYILDQTLDSLIEELDPLFFFRISRSVIVRISAIGKIVKHFNRQLKIVLIPSVVEPVVVSRSRVDELLRWLNR